MAQWTRVPATVALAWSVGGGFALPASGSADQPGAHCVSVDEGLPSPTVQALARDLDGAVWIATTEGLARFDGSEIRAYGRRHGLLPPLLWGAAVDAEGRIWLASHGRGLVLFLDRGRPEPLAATGRLLEAEDGPPRFAAWEAGERGIVGRIEPRAGGGVWLIDRGRLVEGIPAAGGLALRPLAGEGRVELFHAAAGRRSPWLVRREKTGAVLESEGERCPFPAALSADPVELGSDSAGRLFAASTTAVARARTPVSGSCTDLEWELLPLPLAPGEEIRSVAPRLRGGLWVGTSRGLWRTDTGGARAIGSAVGAPNDAILALLDDPRAGLLVGTLGSGLCRLPLEGLEVLSRGEGLSEPAFERVVEGGQGDLYAISESGWLELRGDRLALVPGSEEDPWRHAGGRVVADSGGYWVGTSRGLARIEGARLDPRRSRTLGPESGLPAREVFGGRPGPGLWLAPDASVWVSFAEVGLFVRRPGAKRFVPVADPGGTWREAPPLAFARDAAGDSWIADFLGLRWLGATGGTSLALPGGSDPRSLLLDRTGRLWIGRRFGGLARVVERRGDQLRIDSWTTREGLLSDAIWSIAEDRAGQLWLCTGRGLNRLDPASGGIEAWTAADGLPAGRLHHCFVDRTGRLWIAGQGGVARLDPSALPESPQPEVRWRGVVAGGEPLALSERGERSRSGLRLGPGPAPLAVRVAGPPFARGLRYRFRLEPPAEAAWGEPSPESSVHYAGLGPGRYRLSALAIDAAGRASAEPAVLEFEVAAPFWRRRGFVAAVASLLAAAALAAHRARLARERALSAVRERLAADLHDDLGTGLARIALLAELARRGPVAADPPGGADARLARIAEGARELSESMTDVVWALRPERDTARDLAQRLRRFASDMLSEPGVGLSFVAELPDDLALDAGERRDLLLAGKELVTNVARHARARSVEVALRRLDGRVVLEVRDDGVGLRAARSEGQGLVSLARRAARCGGRFEIAARPGGGTEARFEIPTADRSASLHAQVGRSRRRRGRIQDQ
ncbi:MAG: two-component regulator propeller domain-containing protein [Thermoanaerobaculia bacterium]